MKRKCELLGAVERALFWQQWGDWLEGLRAGLIWRGLQRQNKKQAAKLERRGLL